MGVGVLLLLCCLQMYFNIDDLLGKNVIRKDGFDFIPISKKITNESAGDEKLNQIFPQELANIRSQPFVDDAAALMANEFRVQFNLAGLLRTDLFVESLDNQFIDTIPASFVWAEGSNYLPLIIGSDFLDLYNVFAPAQGLPQISRTAAMNIPIEVTCSGRGQSITFTGRVVAFSDRINSFLVPVNFMSWANKALGEKPKPGASRVYLKTKDANNPALLRYIDSKNYNVNNEKTKFGRGKEVIQAIFAGLGLFGLMVVVLALLLFSFYLQLLIARSRQSLDLLLLIGYSPKWLSKKVAGRFIPIYAVTIFGALLVTQVGQWAFYKFLANSSPLLSPFIHWSVAVTTVVLIALASYSSHRLVSRYLSRPS